MERHLLATFHEKPSVVYLVFVYIELLNVVSISAEHLLPAV